MSALTIDSVSTVPSAGRARSRHLVVVPAAGRPSESAVGHLRLTRRGRLAITLVVVCLLAAVAVVGARAAWAAPTATPATPATATVTVLPGQTLWQIAGSAAPGSDPRDAIIEIRQLNDLSDSQVFAGQVLTVPAG